MPRPSPCRAGGWLECLDRECEDMRVFSRRRKERKQQGCFGDIWLFPNMWEDGCDNGYLRGEQSKRLHQGKAGYSLEGEWWTHTYTHFKAVLQNSLSALLVCLFPGEPTRLTSQHVSDQALISLSLLVLLFCTLIRHHALHPKTILFKPPSQLFSHSSTVILEKTGDG